MLKFFESFNINFVWNKDNSSSSKSSAKSNQGIVNSSAGNTGYLQQAGGNINNYNSPLKNPIDDEKDKESLCRCLNEQSADQFIELVRSPNNRHYFYRNTNASKKYVEDQFKKVIGSLEVVSQKKLLSIKNEALSAMDDFIKSGDTNEFKGKWTKCRDDIYLLLSN